MEAVILERKTIRKIERRTHNNDLISDFLLQKSDNAMKYNAERYAGRAASIRDCGRNFYLDYYRLSSVKYVKGISTCRDRFCSNCQSNLAAKRQSKYEPIFRENESRYGFQNMHVVLTVPNCDQADLESTIDRLFTAFAKLVKFFRCKKKIRGYDFNVWSFRGAVRGLEITKAADGKFHPHIHSVWSFGQFAEFGDPKYTNAYSFDRRYGRENRAFTYFEILLQKLWRLCFDGDRVTAKAIDNLDLGYSCTADQITEQGYSEVFKYTMKGCFSKHGDFLYEYKTFDILDEVLYRRRVLQGYGCYFGMKFDDEIDDQLSFKECVVEELNKLEDPVAEFETIDEVYDHCEHIRYITPTKLFEFYNICNEKTDMRSMAHNFIGLLNTYVSVNYA